MGNCDRVLSTMARELYEKAGLGLHPSLIPTWRGAQARCKGGPAALPTVIEWKGSNMA
jgi:folate-dependent phosphoribosylglycinamide formyltransferase PurN